jgi:hypothetical protein
MPTPTLPSYVTIKADGFAIGRQSAVLRTDMESGPPKQSKILSRVLVTRSVVFQFMTRANYNSFITWFRDDLVRGAEWFNWTDPVDGVTKLARIVGGTLDSESPAGGLNYWAVACKLETWDA